MLLFERKTLQTIMIIRLLNKQIIVNEFFFMFSINGFANIGINLRLKVDFNHIFISPIFLLK